MTPEQKHRQCKRYVDALHLFAYDAREAAQFLGERHASEVLDECVDLLEDLQSSLANEGGILIPRCVGCGRQPFEIDEYVDNEYGMAPGEYVRKYEGTYNPRNGHFWCTACYIVSAGRIGVAP